MELTFVQSILWDENLIPSINYTGETCLALPKLNLQFLTIHDYLLRNFNLFRLEATYPALSIVFFQLFFARFPLTRPGMSSART